MFAHSPSEHREVIAAMPQSWSLSSPFWTWVSLLVVLFVCVPPLVIDIGVRDSTHTMENVSLVTAQETWLRQRSGEPNAWWSPTFNGDVRTRKPPMLVWLDMLAWSDLTPETGTTTLLTERARLVTAGLTLVMLASTFWIGMTLGDRQMAVLAALVAGTIFFLQRFGRTASYDVHMTAWATLSVAAALWAMRPFRDTPKPPTRLVGWGIAAAALAASWMSKGPLAILLVLLPVAATIALSPGRRLVNGLWFLAAVSLATALVAPWYVWMFVSTPEGVLSLWKEYREMYSYPHPFYYYFGLLGLVLPWTLWLIAGLIHPFLRGSADHRRRLMMPWLWFVLIFALFSSSSAKQQRYILPIIPAVALLVAQLWRDHEDMAARGGLPAGVRRLRTVHWTALLVASLLAGLFLASQNWLVAQGWLPEVELVPPSWFATAALTAALGTIAVVGWRWHRQPKPLLAGITSGAWTLLLSVVYWHSYAYAPSGVHPVRRPSEQFARVIGDVPMRYLKLTESEEKPNEEFLLYTRRIVPDVWPDELAAYRESGDHVFVMATAETKYDEALQQAGFTFVKNFTDDITRDPHRIEKAIQRRFGKKVEEKVKINAKKLWEHTVVR